MRNLFLTNTAFNFTSLYLMDWSGVDYLWIIVMFLAAIRTHSDGTHSQHPLMSKWCNVKFLQIYTDEETNSSTSWMVWVWVHFHQMFCFGYIYICIFMHLADTFIQSDLKCIQARLFLSVCVCPWELNPWPFALLRQCSTTEPQVNCSLMTFKW